MTNDSELKAMAQITEALESLDEDTRIRVLQWVGNRFYKNGRQATDPISQPEMQVLQPQLVSSAITNLPDFINVHIGDSFRSLGYKEKIIVIAKYLINRSEDNTFSTVDVKNSLAQLGENTKDLGKYMQRLKKEDRAVTEMGNGYILTLKGKEKFDSISTGQQVVAFPNEGSVDESGDAVKPTVKSKKPTRKPEPVAIDKEFLKELDSNSPSFDEYQKEYDMDKFKSNVPFYTLSVSYICNEMGKEKATLVQIATCLKHAGRNMPDFLRQGVSDTANKQGFIVYDGPENITMRAKGNDFLSQTKQAKAA